MNENRINEIIAELSDCREDERNTQDQILQVISVTGTILGIIFSASYLNKNRNDLIIVFQNVSADDDSYISYLCNVINENITYARVLFWLSLLIFSTAFAYIIVLGTNNILRYYYIQTLEDRLYTLIPDSPDDIDRGKFLHWNAYSAPIITKDLKHVSSTHTALVYTCYAAAICCAILFSIMMVTSLFLEIAPKNKADHVTVMIAIGVMFLTIILFLRTSSRAKDVAQFSMDTAHDNQKIRLDRLPRVPYEKARSFRRLLKYFIYPKIQDIQKPLLIVLGFIYGAVMVSPTFDLMDIGRLIFVMFVFDFLAYQARYQINDIRGLEEDEEAGSKNRLLSSDIADPEHVIRLSFKIAIVKIAISVGLTIFRGREVTKVLLICLGLLFASTLSYEVARAKRITWLVFILVGSGYPLRFFVGLSSIMDVEFNVETICIIAALWSYGSFSSILSWANEVTERMQKTQEAMGTFPTSYQKRHFVQIQDILISRYVLCRDHPINGKVMPLREKGRLADPWDLPFVSCLSFLLVVAFQKMSSLRLFRLECIECIVYIAFIISIYLRRRKKVLLMGIGWICIISKILISLVSFKTSILYLLFSVMQMMVTITYFILSYRPQIKKIDYEAVRYKFTKTILGGYVADILCSEDDE